MLPYIMHVLSQTVNFKHLHLTYFACDILCIRSQKLKENCPIKINTAVVVIYSVFILHSLKGTHLQHNILEILSKILGQKILIYIVNNEMIV
jgi:hypothetical protein